METPWWDQVRIRRGELTQFGREMVPEIYIGSLLQLLCPGSLAERLAACLRYREPPRGLVLDFPGTYVDADFADLDGDGRLDLVGLSEPEGIARHSDEPVSQVGYRPFWCRRLPGPGIAFGLSRSLADLAARASRCCWRSCLSCPAAGGGSGLPAAPGRCIVWSWPPWPAAGQGERRFK